MVCGVCSEKGHNALTCRHPSADARRKGLAIKKQFWIDLEESAKGWMQSWGLPEELTSQIWNLAKNPSKYIKNRVMALYLQQMIKN